MTESKKQQITQELVTVSMDKVAPTVAKWIWKYYIPCGEITIFSGNNDTGKTTVACDIVSRITRDADFPDGSPCLTGGEVLMMGTEDKLGILSARLRAAGAAMEGVHYVVKVEIRDGANKYERQFALDTDLAALENTLADCPTIGVVVISPLSAYFGKMKMNDKQEVRRILSPLQQLCEKYDVTILAIEHFNKQSGQLGKHRIGGSTALSDAPRSAFMFAKTPDSTDGEYQMHFLKCNDTPEDKKVGLKYRMEGVVVEYGGKPLQGTVPRVVWLGDASGNAQDLLNKEAGIEPRQTAAQKADAYVATLPKVPIKSDELFGNAPEFVGHKATASAMKRGKWEPRHIGGREGLWEWYPPTQDGPDRAKEFPTMKVGYKPSDPNDVY